MFRPSVKTSAAMTDNTDRRERERQLRVALGLEWDMGPIQDTIVSNVKK